MSEFMQRALELAAQAALIGEVPVGAVVVDRHSNTIIGEGFNQVETKFNPAGHAEIIALQQACFKKQSPRLHQCDLYVTLEPCTMCATAISIARVERLYFGAYDPKGGGVEHGARFFTQPTCHFKPDVYGGIEEQKSAELLQNFFKHKR